MQVDTRLGSTSLTTGREDDNGKGKEIPAFAGMTRKDARMTSLFRSVALLPVFVGGFREASEKGESVKVVFQEVDDLPYHIQ